MSGRGHETETLIEGSSSRRGGVNHDGPHSRTFIAGGNDSLQGVDQQYVTKPLAAK